MAAASPPPPVDQAQARIDRGARRRARTRVVILDAAEEVFARDGFHGARVEHIADRADLSVGTLYVHFANKHALFLALVERSLELFAESMRLSESPQFTPLQRVLAGGDAYLRFHLEHPGLFQFLAAGSLDEQAPAADPQTAQRIAAHVGGLLDRFAAQIDDAVAAGEATPVDSRRLTRFLWGAWNGVIALHHQPAGLRADDEEIRATLETGRWLLREGLASARFRDADGRVGERVPMPYVDPGTA